MSLVPVDGRSPSLTDRVFGMMRDAIAAKTIAPGARVSEASLAAQLKVSKTPIREAMIRLRLLGVLEPAGTGLIVVMPDRRKVHDAYEFRAGLEQQAARLAAMRGTAESRAEIAFAATQTRTAAERSDHADFTNWDRAFHLAVAATSGNKMLERAVDDILVLTQVLRQRDMDVPSGSRKCADQHVAIAVAIGAGDAERAGVLMDDHVHSVMELVTHVSRKRSGLPA